MPSFRTTRRVPFTPRQMFDLVADVERYPEFLPLCEALVVRSRERHGDKDSLVADMTVGYMAIRETFTSRVTLDPAQLAVQAQGTAEFARTLPAAGEPLAVPRSAGRLRCRLLHRLRVQVDDAADAGRRPVRPRLPPLHARLRGAGAGDLRRRSPAARETS